MCVCCVCVRVCANRSRETEDVLLHYQRSGKVHVRLKLGKVLQMHHHLTVTMTTKHEHMPTTYHTVHGGLGHDWGDSGSGAEYADNVSGVGVKESEVVLMVL